jgi:hypothetical protein
VVTAADTFGNILECLSNQKMISFASPRLAVLSLGRPMIFSCECGLVAGEISNSDELVGLRFSCMCKDCQNYAHFLGKADQVLDKSGGTEVVAVFPKLIAFTKGFENIRGNKLTTESGTFRWFSQCCKSPIANSMSSKAGYIGLYTQRLSLADRESLGPICVRANGESGIPPLPPGTSQKFPLKWAFVTIRQIFRGRLKGLMRPNPFFDSQDLPLAPVEILKK